MNQAFLFQVRAYRQDDPTKAPQDGQCIATGSVETRARRRLLDTLHEKGWFISTLVCLDSKPVNPQE